MWPAMRKALDSHEPIRFYGSQAPNLAQANYRTVQVDLRTRLIDRPGYDRPADERSQVILVIGRLPWSTEKACRPGGEVRVRAGQEIELWVTSFDAGNA